MDGLDRRFGPSAFLQLRPAAATSSSSACRRGYQAVHALPCPLLLLLQVEPVSLARGLVGPSISGGLQPDEWSAATFPVKDVKLVNNNI